MCRMWTCYAIILPTSPESELSFHFSYGASHADDDAPARSLLHLVVLGSELYGFRNDAVKLTGDGFKKRRFYDVLQPQTVNILIELITQWRPGTSQTHSRLVLSVREMGAITCSLSTVLWRRWKTQQQNNNTSLHSFSYNFTRLWDHSN